ncbi:MAG: histidine phosphatase family protein [Clostridiales bacterium]|nr:histidine phosphatase family protein [Clostridiales bacterium]
MKLYLLRHGESEGNRQGLLCGWTDVPLTQTGRAQAEATRKKWGSVAFDEIFSSPLKRAGETARIVAGGRMVLAVDALRERNMGEFEGLTWDEVCLRYPGAPDAWSEDPVRYAPPGGESILEVYARCSRAADGLLAGYPEAESLLIVSHGGALACMLAHLLGQPPESALRYRFDNCGSAVVEIIGGFAVLNRLG